MIEAVLFDLDETLLDRTTALRAFLSDQFNRYSGSLGRVGSAEWRDRFVTLDQRGQVHKTLVYPAILAEFGGDPEMQHTLFADYCAGCPAFAVPFNGMIDTLAAIRASGLQIGIVTNGETESRPVTSRRWDWTISWTRSSSRSAKDCESPTPRSSIERRIVSVPRPIDACSLATTPWPTFSVRQRREWRLPGSEECWLGRRINLITLVRRSIILKTS